MNQLEKLQALEIKLRKGISVDQACRQLSLDCEAVEKWIASKKEFQQFEDFADGIWGRATATKAIDTLIEVIAESPDLEIKRRASKDLLEFYRDERKRLELKVVDARRIASMTVKADLFDSIDSPWEFTEGS